VAAATLLLLVAVLVPAAAAAQFTVTGDADAGRRKAEPCAACHGARGHSSRPDAPSLAGQTALYVYIQLYQFRDGRRQNAEMAPFVARLDDRDMQDLAAYFASEPPAPPAGPFDAAKAAAGREVSNAHACERCHRPGFVGQGHVPRLTGLTYPYLVTQLRGYKAQTRADYDGFMTGAAQPLTEQDIDNVAHYVLSASGGG
jgi:cytochrome c553